MKPSTILSTPRQRRRGNLLSNRGRAWATVGVLAALSWLAFAVLAAALRGLGVFG